MARTFMDTWTFDETLKVLSLTGTASTLYKLLNAIRKEVEWPQHKENIIKLQGSGCLKKIVLALRSSHLHVVSVALSILGNSCMDSKSTNKIIFNHNGLSELNHVLKRFPKEDGVHGRAFRIIGNMCQHNMATVILHSKPELVGYTVQFLQKYAEDDESKFTEATVVMGVRALRQLLNGRTFLQMVKDFGLLKAIGALLIKCTNRWTAEKNDQHILENIIKFLVQYSRYKYYPGIIEMRNTARGDALVQLTQLLPLASKKIVKVIMNLISVSQLKSDLPIPEICEGFVKLLRESPVSEDFKEEYRDYIRCLCHLLEHPANRSTDRCRETIPQLIKVLSDFQNPTEKVLETCILIVCALDKCCYHEPLIKEQLECSIIEVLVNKIKWIIGSSKTLTFKHKLQKKRKRKYSQPNISLSKKKYHGISFAYQDLWEPISPASSEDEIDFSFGNTSIKYANRCSSPSSGSECEILTPPWSSPGSSPLSQGDRGECMSLPYPDLSDSEDYSPVCSDAEEESEPANPLKEDDQKNIEIEKLTDGEDENSEDMKISSFSLKYRLLGQILTLLKTYSVIQPMPSELCSEALLLALLKCSNYFDHSSLATVAAVSVICRILQTHDYLIPLMQTDVILAVSSLIRTPHGSSCAKCSQIEEIGHKVLWRFTCLAESGKGKGDIANRLLLGSQDVKNQLVLVIPYIIRNKAILNTLMLTCDGLDILMKLLMDTNCQKKSIQGVCTLAGNNLGICNPQQWVGSSREKMVIKDYRVADDCANIVTFVLDDNSCLSADRDFLSEKSCFFNSLLNGGFRESNENFVKLHHTDYRALKSLIHLLQCDFDKTEPKDIQLETHTLLEVIMLCDRYLLEDLCVFLTECVQQFSMTAKNVPIIYKWSLESRTNILRVESVAYALVGDIDESNRFSMFTELFNLGYHDEIVSDIRALLLRYLTLRGAY